ncbi:50S ribosomal protein L31 type B [Striga asiatica]|uniref:50S ribosomal protein L31 type B n=1 Tax=Striga asiatica TaxID=4170 RepID=A0A5A7QB52_STRAF|nr:50S ribosomal protein L31 type B [Striga asiatica]
MRFSLHPIEQGVVSSTSPHFSSREVSAICRSWLGFKSHFHSKSMDVYFSLAKPINIGRRLENINQSYQVRLHIPIVTQVVENNTRPFYTHQTYQSLAVLDPRPVGLHSGKANLTGISRAHCIPSTCRESLDKRSQFFRCLDAVLQPKLGAERLLALEYAQKPCMLVSTVVGLLSVADGLLCRGDLLQPGTGAGLGRSGPTRLAGNWCFDRRLLLE